MVRDYARAVGEISELQEGLLIDNNVRFGEIQGCATMNEMARPICGRAWWNRIYVFVIVLDLGRCNLERLAIDLASSGIDPRDGMAVAIDEVRGGAICVPCRASGGTNVVGMQCEVNRTGAEAEAANRWVTLEEAVADPLVGAGRLLNLFVADLQLHLSTWFGEFVDPRRYVKLSRALQMRRGRGAKD